MIDHDNKENIDANKMLESAATSNDQQKVTKSVDLTGSFQKEYEIDSEYANDNPFTEEQHIKSKPALIDQDQGKHQESQSNMKESLNLHPIELTMPDNIRVSVENFENLTKSQEIEIKEAKQLVQKGEEKTMIADSNADSENQATTASATIITTLEQSSSQHNKAIPQNDQQAINGSIINANANANPPPVDENIAYMAAICERKKQNFKDLKKWDDGKASFLLMHKELLDTVMDSLDSKISLSMACMQGLLQYFHEKSAIESDYAQHLQQKLPKLSRQQIALPKQQKNQSQKVQHVVVYPALQSVYAEIDDANAKKIHQIQVMLSYLETEVTQLLTKEQSEYIQRVKDMKEQIGDLTKGLQKASMKTLQASQKFSKLYYDQMTVQNEKQKSCNDILFMQLKFINASDEQIEKQHELGRTVTHFWEESFRLEVRRLVIIQTAIRHYLEKETEVYGKSAQGEIPLKILECLKPVEECQFFYSVEQTLPNEKVMEVRNLLGGKHSLSFPDMQQFLSEFHFEAFHDKNLILKELKAQRDIGGLSKKFINCKLIVTIDLFMLIIDEADEQQKAQKQKKCESCMNLSYLTLIPRKEKSLVDIQEKVPGFLFDSKKKMLLKFDSLDVQDELLHYIGLAQKIKGNQQQTSSKS